MINNYSGNFDTMMQNRGLTRGVDGVWVPNGLPPTTPPAQQASPKPASLPSTPPLPKNTQLFNPQTDYSNVTPSMYTNTLDNNNMQMSWSDLQKAGTRREDGRVKRANGMWLTDTEMSSANNLSGVATDAPWKKWYKPIV